MPPQPLPIEMDYTVVDHREGDIAKYLRIEIPSVVKNARRVSEFWSLLREKCDGMPFNELQDDHDYSHVLLGGVTEGGTYSGRSLAKLYRDLFGLQFESLTAATTALNEGMTVNVPVKVEETAFTSFVGTVLGEGDAVINQSSELMNEWSPQKTRLPNAEVDFGEKQFYELIDDSEQLTQLLTDFLESLQQILPNHDERALFLWTLDKSPQFYLEQAYPGLKDPGSYGSIHAPETDSELWDKYESVLGLEVVFIPEITGEGKQETLNREHFSIYSFQTNSIGRRLLTLYQTIWSAFDDEIRSNLQVAFPRVPNFRQQFVEDAEQALDEIGAEFPDYLKVVSEESKRKHAAEVPSAGGVITKASYTISGPLLNSLDHRYYSSSGNYDSDLGRAAFRTYEDDEIRESELSLLEVLRHLAPQMLLFQGLKYELHIDQETLEIEEL